ncbi:hypothetical protein IJ541_02250 [bacterium]|nr:hypothetical protein [bacterium]
MEHLKEANRNLISLRTSLITVLVVLTGGIVGLILSDIELIKRTIFIVFGIYFDVLFICNIMDINKEINKNIGEIKNESR